MVQKVRSPLCLAYMLRRRGCNGDHTCCLPAFHQKSFSKRQQQLARTCSARSWLEAST